jgi:hypothetical protein
MAWSPWLAREARWAQICSPNSSSGMPNTAQSRTPGIWISTDSISAG